MTTATETTPDLSPEQIAANKRAFELEAIGQLAPMWRQADILPAYPADTETVAELLSGNEYDVTRDLITHYLSEKVMQSPGRHNGRLAWTAADILVLLYHLEFRRKWKPFSKLHRHKLTQYERLSELAVTAGRPHCFEDLMVWDFGGLIAMLHEPGCSDLGARQALAAALTYKLREKGIEI